MIKISKKSICKNLFTGFMAFIFLFSVFGLEINRVFAVGSSIRLIGMSAVKDGWAQYNDNSGALMGKISWSAGDGSGFNEENSPVGEATTGDTPEQSYYEYASLTAGTYTFNYIVYTGFEITGVDINDGAETAVDGTTYGTFDVIVYANELVSVTPQFKATGSTENLSNENTSVEKNVSVNNKASSVKYATFTTTDNQVTDYTTVTIKDATESETKEATKQAKARGCKVAAIVDISVRATNPTTGATSTISKLSYPATISLQLADLPTDARNLTIIHRPSNGTTEVISASTFTQTDTVGFVTFETTHFSTYAIAYKPGAKSGKFSKTGETSHFAGIAILALGAFLVILKTRKYE